MRDFLGKITKRDFSEKPDHKTIIRLFQPNIKWMMQNPSYMFGGARAFLQLMAKSYNLHGMESSFCSKRSSDGFHFIRFLNPMTYIIYVFKCVTFSEKRGFPFSSMREP